jgi:hypothetical protein
MNEMSVKQGVCRPGYVARRADLKGEDGPGVTEAGSWETNRVKGQIGSDLWPFPLA